MGGVFYIKKYFHKIKAIFREMALFDSPVNWHCVKQWVKIRFLADADSLCSHTSVTDALHMYMTIYSPQN